MADVSSTTGAPTRLVETPSFRRDSNSMDHRSVKTKSTPTTQKHPVAVARRNARERNRVRQVNLGFVTLRNHIPQTGSKSKKLSKVETLRQAATYIQYLREMLVVDDGMNAFNSGNGSVTIGACPTSNADHVSGFYYGTASSPINTSDQYYNASSPYQNAHDGWMPPPI